MSKFSGNAAMIALAAFVGSHLPYEEAHAAWQDPSAANITALAQSGVDASFAFRDAVTDMFEGPVAQFTYAAKDAFMDRVDEFAVEVPSYEIASN